MNQLKNGLIALLLVIAVMLAISYKGERKGNRELKKENREYRKATDSLETESRLHEQEITRSKVLLLKSEAERDNLYQVAEKREAVLQSRIRNLTKEQAIAIIPKDTILLGQLVLKGLEYDSLKSDYDKLSTLMQFREIEFKNVIINQDSLIMNLNEQVRLRDGRIGTLEDELKAFRKQKRAIIWQRNLAIGGAVGIAVLAIL